MGGWIQNTVVPYSTWDVVQEQLLYNDKLYIVGGDSNGGALNKITAYDTTLDSYDQSLSSMSIPRYQCAGAISGSTIFVFGGYRYDNYTQQWDTLSVCEKYDILTDTWSSINPMPHSKRSMSAARVENNIFVFGGVAGSDLPNAPSGMNTAIYKYNISTNTWTTQVQTYNASSYAAVTVGNYIYLFGGYYYFNTVKKYDTINDTLTTLPTTIPEYFTGGSGFARGTDIYLLGGYNNSKQFLKYDSVDSRWITLPDMPSSKNGGAGGITEDGNIYIMEGSNSANISYQLPSIPGPGDTNPHKTRISG